MSLGGAARRQRRWDLRAAGNFIGGGTGTGLIVTSAVAALAGAPARLPLAAGLGFVLLGLGLVWLEVGKPWRALNVFFHPQTSWMTREGMVGVLLVPACLLGIATDSPALAMLAAAVAVGFLYCQGRILRAARGIPAWRQDAIVPFMLASGLAEGSGLALLLVRPAAPAIAFTLFAALLREAAWQDYRGALARDPTAAPGLGTLAAPAGRAAHAALLAAIALLVLALAIALAAGSPIATVAGPLGGIITVLAAWWVKVLLITRAAFTRGAAVPVVPVRGAAPVARRSQVVGN